MEELSLPKALPHVENGFMLGIFQPNMQGNVYITAAPGLQESSYEVNRNIARVADEIGLSFSLTLGRWKSTPGDSVGYCHHGLDTYTLAAALLAITSRITIISTTHTAIWNPVIAAKLGADLDQIGNGRWGLNIVAGWNESEFQSMGVTLLPHEKRYEQATAWLAAVRELWTLGESSYKSEFFTLDHAECRPRPLQRGGPVVVNAGQSPTGMKFAMQNGEYMFSRAANVPEFRQVRDDMKSHAGFIANKQVIIAESDSAANDRANEIVRYADLLAIARVRGRAGLDGQPMPPHEIRDQLAADESLLRRMLFGDVTIGSPETVAREMAEWAVSTSVDAVCMSMFDTEHDLELFAKRGLEPLGNELDKAGKKLVLTV